MPIDSFRPTHFRVAISDSGLNTGGTAEGFIDPTHVLQYENILTKEGTQAAPTVTVGDSVDINGVRVVFTGTSVDAVIADINLLTTSHHVIASKKPTTFELILTNQTLHETAGILMLNSVGTGLVDLGFVTPVDIAGTAVTTLALSKDKDRGNMRWKKIIETMSQAMTPAHIGAVDKTGGTADAAPTDISFTVTFHNLSNLGYRDSANPDTVLEGVDAIQTSLARGLVNDFIEQREIFNPESVPSIGAQNKLQDITAGKLANSLATAISAITVTPIADVR